MGTDYDEFRKTCPCGKGKIRIGRSSPDHAWVSQYSVHWDANIECPDCQQTYVIEDTDQAMRVVERVASSAVRARRTAYDAASQQFMALPSVADLKRDFASHLDGLNSVAAIYRFPEGHGMAGYAIGTFRENWRGAPHWVQQNVGIWNVGKVAGLLGRNDANLTDQLAGLKALKNAIGDAPTVMGKLTQIDMVA